MVHAARLQRLRSVAAEAELDALAVVPGPNLLYLTGLHFHLSERPTVAFLPVEGRPLLLVPGLEVAKAQGAPYDCDVVSFDDVSGPSRAFHEAVQALALSERWLGVEGRRMRFLELDLLARTGQGPRIFDADAVFTELRIRKSAEEIAAMRRAVAIAEAAFEATVPAMRAGVTERELAAELTMQILRAGSDATLPFAPIVASGENGALPHAQPTGRALRPGDVVTVDWGASFGGYVSDITRNVRVAGAPPNDALVRAHEVVRAANEAGRAAVRPGATGQAVDRATRAVIEAAGLGAAFVHRTGHGIGLEGHEEPQAKEGARAPLAAGMAFTVEPGVYLPGVGGVRIEDDVLVTADGVETLTSLPRELREVG